ncbi:hypothetical protein [Lysobacter sp. M2-1]|uniref:hypothetical protein n=1 Tax=Lysobacter sp. M2-1 TaxID=2916839 RepID=UPI001F5628A3|nr:hypothetical protein [Lysobacter sp. M2-1]
MRTLKAGALYFVLVFGAGFVLGSIRVPFLVPRLGARFAELLEMPVMLAVVFMAARYVIRRYALADRRTRLLMGTIALVLLASAELLLAFLMTGASPSAYVASRDPVSGSAFLAMLVLFAVLPALLPSGAVSDNPFKPKSVGGSDSFKR